MTTGNETAVRPAAGGERVRISDLSIIDQLYHAKSTAVAIECAVQGMEAEELHKEAVVALVQEHEDRLHDVIAKLEARR